MTIYSCPQCDGDLDQEPFGFYCRACQATITNPAVAQGDPDD
jgi:hypothetical protein